jgi:hypothetical protein
MEATMADRNGNSGRSDEQSPDLGRDENSGMSGGSRSGSTSSDRDSGLSDTSRDRSSTSGDSSSDRDSDSDLGNHEIGDENVSTR